MTFPESSERWTGVCTDFKSGSNPVIPIKCWSWSKKTVRQGIPPCKTRSERVRVSKTRWHNHWTRWYSPNKRRVKPSSGWLESSFLFIRHTIYTMYHCIQFTRWPNAYLMTGDQLYVTTFTMASPPSSRSASPEPRSKRRKGSEHKSSNQRPPDGIEPINEDHYFQKSSEFARWLREEKRKVSWWILFRSIVDFFTISLVFRWTEIGEGSQVCILQTL